MSEYDFLGTIIKSAATTIPETVFKSTYLPRLIHGNIEYFNVTWINDVAKSPHNRVNIVDNRGNVLFTVPPLCNLSLDSMQDQLSAKMKYIQAEMNSNALKGNMLLERLLPTFINFEPAISGEFEKEWIAIFERYGLSHLLTKKEIVEETTDDYDDSW